MTITHNKRSMAAVFALAMTCAAVTAVAQPMGGFLEGDRTLAISGSGSSDHDFDSTVASVELDMAWFLTDFTAFAVRQGVGYADTRGSGDWNASTRVALDYFLPIGRCAPFVGAGFGYLYGDNVKDTFFAGPEIGLRRFINDATFINVVVEYQFLFESADEAIEQFDDGRFVYTLGLGVRL